MDAPVKLIPLHCIQCDMPVPANIDEIAWVCGNCSTGQMLNVDSGLQALEFHFHDSLPPQKVGRPFWVVQGRVSMDRKSYNVFNKSGKAENFWEHPRQFYIPAYTCGVDELVDTAIDYLQRQPALNPGHPETFKPVTLLQEDIQAAAEYIVMGVEALRKDKVKKIEFQLALGEPQLWILP